MENKFLKDRGSFHSSGEAEKIVPQKKEVKKWTVSNLILLAILAVMVYVTTAIVLKYFSIEQLKTERERVVKELAVTGKEIEDLNEFIENAQDPEFVEKMARENLKMVRPDETVYFVVK